jgi:hypothetical protein
VQGAVFLLGDVAEGKPLLASCEHGNEPSGSIEDGEFLDWLSDF